MNKLQYDSFYKFLVSVGIILITAPILGIYYYFTGTSDIIITQEEFSQLSEFSLQSLNNRMVISKIIATIFPWFCILLIGFGIFCIIYGSIKWHKIQTDLDEQTHLDTVMKQINAKKLTPSEVAERTVNEALEGINEISSENTIPQSYNQAISQGFEAEKLFYNYLRKKLHKSYDIQQNLRVRDIGYDIVAVSKKNNIDLLYEIKAWNRPISSSLCNTTIAKLKQSAINYEQATHRNCIIKLIIISQTSFINEFKKHFKNPFNNADSGFNIKIECYTKEQLLNQTKKYH